MRMLLSTPQWGPRVASRLPLQLRFLSFPVIAIIALLLIINAIVWVAAGIVLRYHAGFASTALLCYTLGLRHALDADHISAIDLMTRRLIATGQKPVTVGTWFSLGHSTVVIVTCIVVAATSGALEKRFEGLRNVGGVIGTSVSAAVLLILAMGNGWILYKLVKRIRVVLREGVGRVGRQEVEADGDLSGLSLEGGGFLVGMFKKVFKFIDRPWKMYPLGVLFGLGFDTSSEVALLAIASVQGAQGTSFWVILIFPALFTAGMCLLDTTDGALMMTLYTSTNLARDVVAILYYSIILTTITVIFASIIGIIQLLSIIANYSEGPFWDGVNNVSDHYDIIGGVICGSFIVFGVISVIVYKPWRRWVERPYNVLIIESTEDEEFAGPDPANKKSDTKVVNASSSSRGEA